MRLVLTVLLACMLAACAPDGPPPGGGVAQLERIDQKVGSGDVARSGQQVTVHYSGWLYDENAADKRGRKFDSSVDRGEPFTFLLGAGRVIRGWDEGVAGMHVGGKRLLLIPADLGYGREGAGGVIPPNASLVFEVELLAIKPAR
ncbi:FKBP-type peptidyl-prolyl cis-trans isomerase [Pseudoxanthomonas dokdonensis]|uniref:Peptidyl-prolyl cis-trans isomerase n=1 Tax=Pseudoxanthomonas dokdonensis TaxID=344882 RepID=A0A0R0CG72_9GAMM|nr:FKBP-type peptidyl-prolyl cis-trans isomerase [Pseudoxanthomonas dokdonensis]KRG68793.1 peptidylprolyl isomerase [Pseudoxanthomonas dokdonensis]